MREEYGVHSGSASRTKVRHNTAQHGHCGASSSGQESLVVRSRTRASRFSAKMPGSHTAHARREGELQMAISSTLVGVRSCTRLDHSSDWAATLVHPNSNLTLDTAQ